MIVTAEYLFTALLYHFFVSSSTQNNSVIHRDSNLTQLKVNPQEKVRTQNIENDKETNKDLFRTTKHFRFNFVQSQSELS